MVHTGECHDRCSGEIYGFVCSIGCNINVANSTNHKFPAATPTGVPGEVKSTVHTHGHHLDTVIL